MIKLIFNIAINLRERRRQQERKEQWNRFFKNGGNWERH